MRRAWAVAVKELRQIRRDGRTLMILIVVPTQIGQVSLVRWAVPSLAFVKR